MTKQQWSRALVWIGVVGLLLSAIDPLEGAFVALPFGAVLAGGAFLSTSTYRRPLFWAVGTMCVGVAVLVALSFNGGIGGSSGHSLWWGVLVVPYPAGWLVALICGILLLREPPRSIRRNVTGGA